MTGPRKEAGRTMQAPAWPLLQLIQAPPGMRAAPRRRLCSGSCGEVQLGQGHLSPPPASPAAGPRPRVPPQALSTRGCSGTSGASSAETHPVLRAVAQLDFLAQAPGTLHGAVQSARGYPGPRASSGVAAESRAGGGGAGREGRGRGQRPPMHCVRVPAAPTPPPAVSDVSEAEGEAETAGRGGASATRERARRGSSPP